MLRRRGKVGPLTHADPSSVLPLIWAKSQPERCLLAHCVDVGVTAQRILCSPAFARQRALLAAACGPLPSHGLIPWCGYLTALHDLGKCDPKFQIKDPGLGERVRQRGLWMPPTAEPGFRHEARSADWIHPHLVDDHGWDRRAAAVVALIIRGHHGNFGAECDGEHKLVADQWNPLRSELARCLREVFDPPPWSPREFTNASVAGLLLTGLLVLADWIASNERLYEWVGSEQDPAALATAALRSLGFDSGVELPGGSFREAWPEINSPRPVQEAVDDITTPGLCLIETPTGEGKTEAALALASRWCRETGGRGFYIGLPTAATSNQMHARVRRFVGSFASDADVRLVHGMAWLIDDDTPDGAPGNGDGVQGYEAASWFRPSRRALIAPFGVGTVDQAMMAALHVRFGFLRLFGLASGVLVIDEIHAYDAYMSVIIAKLLRWCAALEIPVILLSATLPRRRRTELVRAYGGEPAEEGEEDAYPLITVAPTGGPSTLHAGLGVSRCVELGLGQHKATLGDAPAIARLAADRAAHGGCLCVLMNTVRSAQDVYRQLHTMVPSDCELILFHARFTAGRRAEIERRVLDLFDGRSLLPPDHTDYRERPARAILVATQVVEQSLDVDFDGMVTELAPMDLLIQRAGRVHRHQRERPPHLAEPSLDIALPSDEAPGDLGPTGRVYQPFILLKTLAVLRGREVLHFPAETRSLIEAVYDDNPEIPGIEPDLATDTRRALDEGRREMELAAGRYLIADPDPRKHAMAEHGLGQGAFQESEDGRRSFLHAQTRHGDESRSVLVLEGDAYAAELAADSPPPRATLRAIMLHSVRVPRWWLTGLAESDAAIAEATWLRGVGVLRTDQGVWTGSKIHGKVVIHNDPELGLLYEETA